MLSVISVRVTLDHRLRRLVSLPTSMNSTSPLETKVGPELLSSHEDPDGPEGVGRLRSTPCSPAAPLVLGLTPPATGSLLGGFGQERQSSQTTFPSLLRLVPSRRSLISTAAYTSFTPSHDDQH